MGVSVAHAGPRDVGKAVVKGGLIGVANVIPGVSGGTLALMLGIYQRTINAICSVNAALLQKVLVLPFKGKAGGQDLWTYAREQDLFFLGWLGGGAIVGIVLFARVMGWLLEQYREPSSAFFLGLVLASIVFPWRYLTRRSWREICAFALACALAVGLSMAVSEEDRIARAARKQVVAEESFDATVEAPVAVTRPDIRHLMMVFGGGVLALSAMVLPGVSGSFILLLLGVYADVLRAVNQREMLVLAVFLIGGVVGLLVFTRVMGWLLARIFNLTMGFMIGLMVGSLYELWPFKRTIYVGEELVVLGNRLQGIGFGDVMWTGLAFLVGIVLVSGFAWAGKEASGEKGDT